MEKESTRYPVTVSVDIGDLQVVYLMNSGDLTPKTIATSPSHLHTKHELQFIFSGQLEARVDETFDICVPQGSALLIPPNILHSNKADSGKRLIATLALQPLRRRLESAAFSEFHHYCALFGRVQQPLILHSENISRCVSQLICLENLPENAHMRKNLLAYLFIQLGQAIESQSRTGESQALQLGNRYNHQYYVIEQYINKNYNKPSSVDRLAEELHMSRRQVDRIVEQSWGKTYATLILDRRMLIAKKLLEKTDMPCGRIAEQVGYTSYPGFYLAFRRYYEKTPEQVRSGQETAAGQPD